MHCLIFLFVLLSACSGLGSAASYNKGWTVFRSACLVEMCGLLAARDLSCLFLVCFLPQGCVGLAPYGSDMGKDGPRWVRMARYG